MKTLLRRIARLGPLFMVMWMLGCSTVPTPDYQPRPGQMGKDVMWLPTGDDLVSRMLAAARVTPDDEVVDLGAGDGRIPIAAAKQFGARAWGIEYDPRLVELARRNAREAGVADKVRMVHGDIFQEDFSSATVVTMYLLEELNERLRPTLLAMRPGTRVLSNSFSMGDWEPDQVIRTGSSTGYFWTVPAPVQGRWSIDGLTEHGPAVLSLSQRFQRVGGTLSRGMQSQPLLGVRLEGAELHFSYIDAQGLLKAVMTRVQGQAMEGRMVGPYGMPDIAPAVVKVSGRRLSD
jgi:hypothetical protein